MTGKQRASQIPLDYFKGRGPLEWARLVLVIAVPLLALGWWVSGFAVGDRGHARYTHGTLAAVHATWDRQCEACHVPFRPINDRTIGGKVGDTWGPAHRCESCHRGPVHHANQAPDIACASCHHDHRGRDHDLARSPDGDCAQCHANLGPHIAVGKAAAFVRSDVSRFDDGHPPFRLPEKDPGHLKFSHARHLKEGLDLGFTYEKIEAADRGRYLAERKRIDDSSPDLSAPVRLDCVSCHRLERGDGGPPRADGLPVANAPAASSGSYMIPVSYGSDCRGCHSLRVEARIPGDPSSEDLTVPHGRQPAELDRYLWGAYAERFLTKADEVKAALPRRPGRAVGDREDERDFLAGAVEGAARTLFSDDAVRRKVEAARNVLTLGRQTCAECHEYEKATVNERPKVVAPGVPEVWFEHARFDHAAHRAVSCRECHARAYPDDAGASVASSDVLMPSIETCRQCHAPRRESASAPSGGARFDCVECHRYHNGDERLKGVGALARDAEAAWKVGQFLRGGLPHAESPTSPASPPP